MPTPAPQAEKPQTQAPQNQDPQNQHARKSGGKPAEPRRPAGRGDDKDSKQDKSSSGRR